MVGCCLRLQWLELMRQADSHSARVAFHKADEWTVQDDVAGPAGGVYHSFSHKGGLNQRQPPGLAQGGSVANARRHISSGLNNQQDEVAAEGTGLGALGRYRSGSPGSKLQSTKLGANNSSLHSVASENNFENNMYLQHQPGSPKQKVSFPTQILSRPTLGFPSHPGSYIETGSDWENRSRKPTLAEVLETVSLNSKRTTALPHSAKYSSVERISSARSPRQQEQDKLNDSSEAPDTNRDRSPSGMQVGSFHQQIFPFETNTGRSFETEFSGVNRSARPSSFLTNLVADYASSASIHFPQVKQIESLKEENARLHLENAILANRVNMLGGTQPMQRDLLAQYESALKLFKQLVQDLRYKIYESETKIQELNIPYQQQLGQHSALTERRLRLLQKLHFSRSAMWELPSAQDNPLSNHQRLQRVRSNPLLPRQIQVISPAPARTATTSVAELVLMKLSSLLCGEDEELPTLMYVHRLESLLEQYGRLQL